MRSYSWQPTDFIAAAFTVGRELDNGVYRQEFARALTAFTTLPCVETAAALCAIDAAFFSVINGSSDTLAISWPEYAAFRELRVASLRQLDAFHTGLREAAARGRIRVGFPASVDKLLLRGRLQAAGRRLWPWSDVQGLIRQTLIPDLPTYRSLFDLVCIEASTSNAEYYFSAFGFDVDPEHYNNAQVMIDAGPIAASLQDIAFRGV